MNATWVGSDGSVPAIAHGTASPTMAGNGVFVMPVKPIEAISQPAAPTPPSQPMRKRSRTVAPAKSVPKLPVTVVSAGYDALWPT